MLTSTKKRIKYARELINNERGTFKKTTLTKDDIELCIEHLNSAALVLELAIDEIEEVIGE